MKLSPTRTQPAPSYPAHSPRLRRALTRARKVACAATASLALSMSACYGMTRHEPIDTGDADLVETSDAGIDGDIDATDAGTDGDVEVTDATVPPNRDIEWCEPDYRLSGEAMPPSLFFVCGVEMPEDVLIHPAPSWLMTGQLCGDQTAWAQVEVEEPFDGAVSFPYDTEVAAMRVFAPDGSLVVSLDPEHPCGAFDVEAGIWTLAIDAVDPDAADDASFTVAFDQFYEY